MEKVGRISSEILSHVFQMIENSPEMFSRKKNKKNYTDCFFSLGFTHENIMSPQFLKKKKKKKNLFILLKCFHPETHEKKSP